MSAEEWVDVLDRDGQVVGVTTRAEMRARHLPHRCVYILVFNSRGDLFIHQRTATKDLFPSYWDVAIGGVVAAGESFDQAAAREGAEEIGVSLAVEVLFPFTFADAGTICFAHVYRGIHDGPFRLQPEEIVQGCFVRPEEIAKRAQENAFCPDGLKAWAEFERRGLRSTCPFPAERGERKVTECLVPRIRRLSMSQAKSYDDLVLGSGAGGKLLAWHLAQSGRRVAVVERRWIGGSCPNVNCLPSKNEVWSAKVADLVHHAAQFGIVTGSVAVDMAKVRQRKREMVEGLIALHLDLYHKSGAELIMGDGRFVAPKTLEVSARRRHTSVVRRTHFSQRGHACDDPACRRPR